MRVPLLHTMTRAKRIHLAAAALLGFSLVNTCPSASAQNDVLVPSSGAVVSNTKPDAQIVVLVLPTGTYAVSSVYPKRVSKAVAEERMTKLLKLTKWQATNHRFSDAPAISHPSRGESMPNATLSAASFETSGPIYAADGTIDWEPLLQAFGDLHRVNFVCFTGPEFVYRGPVTFQNERIAFSASAGQGAVAVAATLKKPEPSPVRFGLPQYAATPPAPTKETVANTPNSQGSRAIRILFVTLFATGVALIIYLLTTRLVSKS